MPPPIRHSLNLTSTTLFDALIIGGGPAGLSAALALCRVNRTVALFDNKQYRNERAHRAHTIYSRDHMPPEEIRKAAQEQIDAYGTVLRVEKTVVRASRDDEDASFKIEDDCGEVWKGKRIVLAMGVRDIPPTDIDGYQENWGHNIYQCLFCDGLERQKMPAGVLGFEGPMTLHNISMIRQIGCPEITIFANGPLVLEDRATRDALKVARAKGADIDERRIQSLINVGDEAMDIVFEDGSTKKVGFLAHKPDTALVGRDLIKGLGVEIVGDGHGGEMINRDEPFGATNIKGIFCAGDAGGIFRQVATAAYQGVAAGGGVQFSLTQEQDCRVAK